MYLFFPETLGRSLEEVDEVFAGASGAVGAVKYAEQVPHRHTLHTALGYELGDEDQVKGTESTVENVPTA